MSATTPREVDAIGRRDNLGIAAVRDLIPKECFAIVPLRSWMGLCMAIVRVIVAEAILYALPLGRGAALYWQIPALAAAWLFAGWAFTGLFVIGHDCGHLAFSEKRWVNSLVGHLVLAPEFTGFHNWRIWHNHHHARTQARRVDPDWAEMGMTRAEYDAAPLGQKAHVKLGFGTPAGVMVGFWVGMVRRTFMRKLAPQIPLARGADRELLTSTLFMVLSCTALSVLLVRWGGAFAVVKYYYVPAFIAAAHGALLTFLHHASPDSLSFDRDAWTPFRGQVVSTFNVRFPRFVEAMWFDINVHLPHHIAPRIPWYHLRTAADAIKAARPDLYIERRFSFGYLRAIWNKPLLARVPGEDYYAAISFAESEQPEASVEASAS